MTIVEDDIVNREEFELKLKLLCAEKKSTNTMWDKKTEAAVIKILKECQISPVQKTSQHRYFSKMYDLLKIGKDREIVVLKEKEKKRAENREVSEVYVRKICVEDMYPKLLEAHLQTGHGGRDKILFYAAKKWILPKKACSLFVKLCKSCTRKKTTPKNGVVIKPIVTNGYNMRGQVDLIDFQSCPDGDYKFIMNFQDHATKFLHLRPLKSKHAVNVAGLYIFVFKTITHHLFVVDGPVVFLNR